MSKKLEILVPHYKESPEEIKPLLDSIALQQAVDLNDVGVIICHDGPEAHDLEIADEWDLADASDLPPYPFEIKQIRQEHKGVSAARNACLDAATADYIMFCDCDDLFFNMCGLHIIFNEMKGDGFNALVSIFIEEIRAANGDITYINHETDFTFVHGKVYRLSYLRENNIRWDEKLTIHEDSFFNGVACKMTKEVKYCKHPFYMWKWRKNSVCRHDPKYILKTYNNLLESNVALINEMLMRGHGADAKFYVCAMVYAAYFTMNKKEWLDQENQEYRYKTEKYFQDCWFKYKDLYDDAPQEAKQKLIVSQKNNFFKQGGLFEAITFDDWIKHITELQ